jgi:flagellar biosynthetic protein FlhB
MAETDQSQKTEEPTQKKLEDAHREGQVPKSQEVRHWFMMAGMALAMSLFAADGTRRLASILSGVLEHSGRFAAGDGEALRGFAANLMEEVFFILGMPFLVLVIAAVAGNMIQHRPVWSTEKLKPDFAKISPMAGAKRLFSMQSLAEFLKSLLKLAVVGAVVFGLVWPERSRLAGLVTYDVSDILLLVLTLTLRMLGGVVAAMTIVAGADFLFQRLQFRKQQRMSRQEVRDEYRQMEGDPAVKGKLRQLRLERSRKRMMAAVPDATVVITNPTHYAVALKYETGKMPAPVLVAKGVDAVAFRIREKAQEHEIPIVENPPLARALYASVELDEAVPPEHYKAVAEVIGFVLKLSRKRPKGVAGRQS